MKDYIVTFVISEEDFVFLFKRKPTKEEFETFCRYCKSGLDAQIDWAMIFDCAKDAMKIIEEVRDEK